MSEIAQRVDLHKSTVHRLLAALEKKGFVIRNPSTDKYRLGLRVWELAANLWRSDDPAVILLPEMERLRDAIGETVSLYIRDGHERIRIQSVQSHQSVRRVAPIGVRLPLYLGASSKVLLAYESEAVREEIMSAPDWPKATHGQKFREQLAQIAADGYATSIEEREPGAAAVAAPIFNRSQKLVAALSVSGPVSRFTPDQLKRYADAVKETAKRMEKMLK